MAYSAMPIVCLMRLVSQRLGYRVGHTVGQIAQKCKETQTLCDFSYIYLLKLILYNSQR